MSRRKLSWYATATNTHTHTRLLIKKKKKKRMLPPTYLASLGPDLGPGGGAGGARGAEVVVGIAGCLAAAEENSAGSRGDEERELVKRQALATGLDDACAGTLSEAKCADAELGEGLSIEANVVGDGAHHDGDLALLALHVAGEASEADGGAVVAAHHQALGNHSIEATISPAREESVELHKEVGARKKSEERGRDADVREGGYESKKFR